MVTAERRPILGALTGRGVKLTPSGEIVRRYWDMIPDRFRSVSVDTLVIKPDHLHAIVVFSGDADRRYTLSNVIGWVKQRASREIHASRYLRASVWQ